MKATLKGFSATLDGLEVNVPDEFDSFDEPRHPNCSCKIRVSRWYRFKKHILPWLLLAIICIGFYFFLLNILTAIWWLSTPLVRYMP